MARMYVHCAAHIDIRTIRRGIIVNSHMKTLRIFLTENIETILNM